MVTPLPLRPFTPENFAPYGEVIESPPHLHPSRLVNQGFVRRYDDAFSLANLRPHARLNIAFFRCQPRPQEGFLITLMERHPDSAQLFLPMGPARYLIVVALGDQQPDLSTLAAFLAQTPQGVNYYPNVWHLPLVAFDQVTDFICFVSEDGSARDCEVAMLPPEEHRILEG